MTTSQTSLIRPIWRVSGELTYLQSELDASPDQTPRHAARLGEHVEGLVMPSDGIDAGRNGTACPRESALLPRFFEGLEIGRDIPRMGGSVQQDCDGLPGRVADCLQRPCPGLIVPNQVPNRGDCCRRSGLMSGLRRHQVCNGRYSEPSRLDGVSFRQGRKN